MKFQMKHSAKTALLFYSMVVLAGQKIHNVFYCHALAKKSFSVIFVTDRDIVLHLNLQAHSFIA